jgi:ATP-dependent DNA helicase RecG
MRTETELRQIFQKLVNSWESEVVEFKQADNSFKTSELGHYFSALSNEANLRGLDTAWLVFGVHDKTRQVVGTQYKHKPGHLMALKNDVKNGLDPSITFREIHELALPGGRVILFEIPPAPAGMPVGWHGHRYARAGESLSALGVDKEDAIRSQSSVQEWSAEGLPEAKASDLDPKALQRAREVFSSRHSQQFSEDEVAAWTDHAFLGRIGLLNQDDLTRAAILLLGKAESAYHLNPHLAQITWKLDAEEKAYEHYGPPFLLNTTAIYHRIRNLNIRLLPANELIGEDVAKYEQAVVLEALHNAIAHQDYRQNARIIITEFTDILEIENMGGFYEGEPEGYIEGLRTPRRYRNTVLVQAMAHLGMIDTMGYGIHRMFRAQAARSFPLPDYDLSEANAVRLRIYGKVVDPAYTRLLLQKTGIPLNDVLALDRIQKDLPADDKTVRRLRKAKWIEGKKPNLHISAKVAEATDSRADYIRTRAQDDAHYQKLVLDYLASFKKATREEINKLLLDKLSDALDGAQKDNKIRNLLTTMRSRNLIRNQGSRRNPEWVLLNEENLDKK